MMPKVKVCGLTRPEDAEVALEIGATHLGCVLVPDSPRRVEIGQAREIRAAAGKAELVLVFGPENAESIREAAEQVGTKSVQVYGGEPEEMEALEKAGFKVYRVHEIPSGSNLLPPLLPPPSPKRPCVLDVAQGASGITFPWEILGTEAPDGAFISGNVRPENVCALMTHSPYGIDVSTGVEYMPGIKDRDRLKLLFAAIQGTEEE